MVGRMVATRLLSGLAVVVVLAGCAAGTAPSPPAPTTTVPPASLPGPTYAPTPGPSASPTSQPTTEGVEWARLPNAEAVLGGAGDQWLYSLAVGSLGLVAVGTDGSGGDQDAAVWTSVDGLAWSRVAHEEAVFGGSGDQWMYWMAAGGSGLVAVGSDSASGDFDAAVWLSPPPSGLPEPTAHPSPTAAPTPQPLPETWQRGTSTNLGYSLALPPGSYLAESVQWQSGQGPYDQWMVMSPDGGLAFGLLIGHDAKPYAGSTMPPVGATELTEALTADGVRVLVGEASGIDIIAGAVRDGYGWMFMAESGDIVGNDAKRSLLLQIISTFRFAGPDFVPPTAAPTASPTP